MSIRNPRIALTAAAAVIALNLLVIRPSLNAAEEPPNCPSPRPACAEAKDCKDYTCKICFPNPLGLHCTDA